MRLRDALKLDNHDQVSVRTAPGKREFGIVIGRPKRFGDNEKRVFIDVLLDSGAYMQCVPHTDIG